MRLSVVSDRLHAVSGLSRVARYRWRIIVFPASVFSVHQLSYLLAYGSHAGSELSAHGDNYVATAAAVAVALVAVSLGGGSFRLLAARRRGRPEPAKNCVSLWLVWLGWTLALVAGFCALEGLELVFEPHHVGGVVGVFGSEGWWAPPAAAFVGAAITLVLLGGSALLTFVTRDGGARGVRTVSLRRPSRPARASRRRPMAGCAPGRAPPVVELVYEPAPARRVTSGVPV